MLGLATRPEFSSVKVPVALVSKRMRRESFRRKALNATEQQLAQAGVGTG